ncbi:receptor-like protein EIX2 [Lycium ferocissimum]|uniref:receptor-like protein EIX2 n=1 Tax=Lycium ferocissimum TaxID=112874 RepID=UPI002814F081|nr:receptor-like protein EIX2 [Lycium ferocissimum]
MKIESFLLLNISFSLFIGLVFETSSVGNARSSLCIERERQALLKFKQGLIDNSGILSSWGIEDEKKECCSWEGVKCSNITGHVVVLDIQPPFMFFNGYSDFSSGSNLRGSITPSLLELQHLKHLDLSYNDFGGSRIPDFIGSFPRLEYLNLEHANFSGEIPHTFGNLTHLQILELSWNQISGPLPNLKTFSALRELHLNNNQFKGILPQSVGQLSKLEILSVNSNFLEGSITESHLSNLSNLKELDLSYNSFSFQLGPNWIPPFELDIISLSRCEMGHHFPQWLRTQKNYSYLDISFVGISGVAPNWFWDLSPEISYFNISNNKISGEIPDLYSKFVASKESNFPVMDFSSNNLSGLVPSFPSYLDTLNLSKNKFVGSISFLCKIANPFFHILDLSNNLLSGELPDCLMEFEELAILNLANNNLHGKIPSSVGALHNIQSLQLQNNNFTGHLPTSLMNCSMLTILDVGGNKLSGEIPSWIGSELTSLVVLSLRVNKFNGKIPPNLCRLNQVHILDLSRNILSGEIPQCLNNFTSFLHEDSLNPSIIINVGGINGQGYYTSAEDYMGDALVQWKSSESVYNKTLGLLKIIDFSSNELVGRVPKGIAQLGGLLSLNLSRNNLTESLDLSKNQLTGRIPTSLAQLNFLSVLDLSSNNLSGKIPSSTQLQSFDPSSYAGNNELCGPPLAKCPGDRDTQSRSGDHRRINNLDEDDNIFSFGFYIEDALELANDMTDIGGLIVHRSVSDFQFLLKKLQKVPWSLNIITGTGVKDLFLGQVQEGILVELCALGWRGKLFSNLSKDQAIAIAQLQSKNDKVASAKPKEVTEPGREEARVVESNGSGAGSSAEVLKMLETLEKRVDSTEKRVETYNPRVDQIPGAPPILKGPDSKRYIQRPFPPSAAPKLIPKRFKMLDIPNFDGFGIHLRPAVACALTSFDLLTNRSTTCLNVILTIAVTGSPRADFNKPLNDSELFVVSIPHRLPSSWCNVHLSLSITFNQWKASSFARLIMSISLKLNFFPDALLQPPTSNCKVLGSDMPFGNDQDRGSHRNATESGSTLAVEIGFAAEPESTLAVQMVVVNSVPPRVPDCSSCLATILLDVED